MKFALLVFLLPVTLSAVEELAFEGARGFGAHARGGKGGRVIEVTRLDDDLKEPQPGMFRWAVQQKGPRIIKFKTAGTILLKNKVEVREPFITIDGQDAPGLGVCLRGGNLEFKETHDIIVRHIRVRLGDEAVKRANAEEGLQRPKGSDGLDCISLNRCRNAIIDHVSTSWCCDELFSVVRCQNVTVQWCLLAEPLSNPELHPYGDNHAFGFNASASTLSVHHCLFARYVMRGPQFEANDMRAGDGYAVQMEAVNNVMFDYQRSGSRYTTGVEQRKEEATPAGYAFQFMGNVYAGNPKRPEIEAVMKHGVHAGVKSHASDAALIHLSDEEGREDLMDAARAQIQQQPLFTTDAPVVVRDAATVLREVLKGCGCSHARDAADERILADVESRIFRPVLRSQSEAGGWPELR